MLKVYFLFLVALFASFSEANSGDKDLAFWSQRSEEVKSHYRNQDWSAFFAAVMYFRLHRAQNPSSSAMKPFRDNYLALELLGLSKHCRWDLIVGLKKAELSEEILKELPQTSRALDFISLKRELPIPEVDKEQEVLSALEVLKSKRDQWPMRFQKLAEAKSPKGFQLNVESKCESKQR